MPANFLSAGPEGHSRIDLSADGWLGDRLAERGLAVERIGEDALPSLAPASVDLAVSVGLLDTINDLPGALALLRRALKPDGLFLAAFAGAGSLPRLREAMRAAETAEQRDPSPRICVCTLWRPPIWCSMPCCICFLKATPWRDFVSGTWSMCTTCSATTAASLDSGRGWCSGQRSSALGVRYSTACSMHNDY